MELGMAVEPLAKLGKAGQVFSFQFPVFRKRARPIGRAVPHLTVQQVSSFQFSEKERTPPKGMRSWGAL
jgi:hypothetical protein